MARRQSTRKGAGGFRDYVEWKERQRAARACLQGGDEAAGRAAWDQSTATGLNLVAQTPSDVIALGRRLRALDPDGSFGPRPDRTAPAQVRRVVRAPAPAAAPSGDEGADWLDRLNRNPVAKSLAGEAGLGVGLPMGVGRALVRSAKGVPEAASLLVGLKYPEVSMLGPGGRSLFAQFDGAVTGLVGAESRALDYTRRGVANPRIVADDLKREGGRLAAKFIPGAAPGPDTIAGNFGRNLNVGANLGELSTDVGLTVLAPEAAEEVFGLRALSKDELIDRYLRQGFRASQAERLAKAYTAVGHHSVPQRVRIPEKIGPVPVPSAVARRPLPSAFMDSWLNVLRPGWMSTGEMYERHALVDKHFHGARFSPRIGGSWSAKKLGIKKYGPFGRFYHGSPITKPVVTALSPGAPTDVLHVVNQDPRQ